MQDKTTNQINKGNKMENLINKLQSLKSEVGESGIAGIYLTQQANPGNAHGEWTTSGLKIEGKKIEEVEIIWDFESFIKENMENDGVDFDENKDNSEIMWDFSQSDNMPWENSEYVDFRVLGELDDVEEAFEFIKRSN